MSDRKGKLSLTVQEGQRLHIGKDIIVELVRARNMKATIRTIAPVETLVLRCEVANKDHSETPANEKDQ
jgi:sRNA-binding carbon storage regulator CsrA